VFHKVLRCLASQKCSITQRSFACAAAQKDGPWNFARSTHDSRASAPALATALASLAAAATASAWCFSGPAGGGSSTRRIDCDEKQWPIYSMEEVGKHVSAEVGIWVTFKDNVYDITEFVRDHPGGDRIMLAAGKAIDPFWRLYQLHESRGNATKILETLQIGKLDPQDLAKQAPASDDDPYSHDPADRHPALIYHSNKPCNAELPMDLILDNWITPNELWFIRHHHPVPHVDGTKFLLTVEGLGIKTLTISLEDLRKRFLPVEVTATLQCGGNRREEFNEIHETSGISWGCGAMSTAVFKGALLRDVLTFGGLLTPSVAEREGVKHIIFEAVDEMQASIPIEKALSPYGDVLIAYEMNGKALPPEHGYPVRMVVPGHVGVRNVKWVERLRTSSEEAVGPWQRGMSYKGFSPSLKSCKDMSEEDIAQIQSIQEQPVTSMILEPKEGSTSELDDITVRGIAWSGGGRSIVRVDVTVDDGKTWHTAVLKEGSEQHPARAWAWTFWECDVPKPEGLDDGDVVEICAKATDASYNSQPESIKHIWNLRGINNNSWPRVHVKHAT